MNQSILEKLIENNEITEEQVEAIHEEHLRMGKPVHQIAVELGFISEKKYLEVVANQLSTRTVSLANYRVPPETIDTVPAAIARMYAFVPYGIEKGMLTLAVSDIPSPAVIDEISFVLSCPIGFVVASSDEIAAAVMRIYGEDSASTADLLSAVEADLENEKDLISHLSTDSDTVDIDDLEHAANSTPVIRFVNLVLYQAVKDKASDIHFEPFEHEFKIRYRVDGALYEMAPPPKGLALPIISRIKVISNLNIAETRLPQDGRIQLKIAGHSVDFRVSTLPTQFGESVVLRVLDRSNVQLDINNIGFPDHIKQPFMEDIVKPNGIIIVTGPTGSGKTTTLYAALQQVNKIETKILTAEDPVEYDIDGIIQLPVRDNIGLTFSSALRSFLRQDPDVIMVGEIRDIDTAQIAIQASLTGHLVFSTLHTNDAAGAITRLIDMDIEPFLISSTLETVLAQRLLRRICRNCRKAFSPDQKTLDLLELSADQVGDRPFYFGEGCPECNRTGYSGRNAIFEYMRITDPIRTAIIDRKPTLSLRNKAIQSGMRTLREDGIRCILDGYTTVEEVVQYT